MNRCRVCGSPDCRPLDFDGGDRWRRCLACGSDSSNVDPVEAFRQYLTFEYHHHLDNPPHDPSVEALAANIRWFRDYRGSTPNGTEFLDVGCLDGAGLRGMSADGWRVTGFDVNPHAEGAARVVYPCFTAALFGKQFDAVMCREVIEHVDSWRMMLAELYKATRVGGVCQVQTPRPTGFDNPIGYQSAHLQLFSPMALEGEIRRAGFEVCDYWRWELGQAYMLRRS